MFGSAFSVKRDLCDAGAAQDALPDIELVRSDLTTCVCVSNCVQTLGREKERAAAAATVRMRATPINVDKS